MGTPRNVVFVCDHGSGKSLIAAEHFRRLAAGRGLDVDATSLGIEPDAEVPPRVVKGLLEDCIDVRGYRPRRLTGEALATASYVVSFGCDLGALAPPGLRVERWDDAPAVREDFRAARDLIVARLPRLLANCEVPPKAPLAQL